MYLQSPYASLDNCYIISKHKTSLHIERYSSIGMICGIFPPKNAPVSSINSFL